MDSLKELLYRDFTEEKPRRRNINKIRTLYDLSYKSKYTIDDSTWDDLIMDDVFNKIDRTLTSQGEASLYAMLRNPLFDKDKLEKRSSIINFLREHKDLSVDLRYILFKMGGDPDNSLIEMVEGLLSVSKTKAIIYMILGIICPIGLTILAIFFQNSYFFLAATIFMYINICIHSKEIRTVKAKGIVKLRDMLSACHKILKLNPSILGDYNTEIKECLHNLKKIDRSTFFIKFITGMGGLMEFIAVPFLLEVITYYKISGELIDKEGEILKLYYTLGEIDALISMASLEESYKDSLSKPQFIKEIKVSIKDGIHPLLKEPVPNSICIENKGIVLSGTNMSGKSTFLRMIGTNILFAQCFNIAFAKEYSACFFNLVSSISPKDDINSGKSYYMAEAESILRIIDALDYDIPVFTTIDEIFRGTNPIERISSSAEILKYINDRPGICIAATHDREICEILKKSYDFYHFSESVDDKTGLNFDYKLKKGISNTRNAIKVLQYIGYPKEIIEASYNRCKQLTNYL